MLRWRGVFLAVGVGFGLLACSGEEDADPVAPGPAAGSGGSSAGSSAGGGAGGSAGGSSGSGGSPSGSGGGGSSGAGGSTSGSGGSDAGASGNAGNAGAPACGKDEDCADKLPSTVNPAGCAEALCEAGACVFRARDKDGDGKRAKFCKDTSGEVEIEVGNDCDDNDKTVFPGAWDGPEGEGHAASCDGIDNDCSGTPDDNVLSDGTSCSCKPGAVQVCSQTAGGKTILWPLGEPAGICKYGEQKCVIDDATGVGKWGPCIGAIEPTNEACNKEDDDCDGKVDEPEDAPVSTWYYDGDGDGYAALVPGTQTPFATITACFKPDQIPAECMVPGYCPGEPGSCCPPAAWKPSLTALDCDDRTDKVSPLAKEVCSNGVDDNCDGQQDEFGALGEKTYVYDQDGDGFSDPNVVPVTSCTPPDKPPPSCAAPPCPLPGWKEQGPSIQGGDCNDSNPNIKPGALEICDDAKVDENCNGSKNEGCACADGEVLDCGSLDTCNFVPKGSTCVNGKFTQCAFENKQKEQFCKDQDNDGSCLGGNNCALYCPASTPAGQGPKAPAGYRLASTCNPGVDCNDSNPNIYPGAPETCGDGVDSDCDGDAGGEDPDFGEGQECAVSNGVGACAAGGTKVCAGMGTSCSAKADVGANTCQTSPFTSSLGSSWDWNCNGSVDPCAVTCTAASNPGCQCTNFVTEPITMGTHSQVLKNYSSSPTTANACAPAQGQEATFCSQFTAQDKCQSFLFVESCCDQLGGGAQTGFTCLNPCGKKLRTVTCAWNSSTGSCGLPTNTPICNSTIYNNNNRFFGCR